MYCVSCKKPEMKDIRSKKCIDCKVKQPFFGNAGGKPTHCSDCKSESMVDLKSFKCIICKIKCPVFGKPGQNITHCGDCKTDNLVDLKNKKCVKCSVKQPTYGCPTTREITHCKRCKLVTDVDLRHVLCKTEYCDTRANKELRGYCSWCFQHLFPDDPLTQKIPRKTFEIEVSTTILSHDPSYKHDTRLEFGGCDCLSRRRIDFWKIIGNTIIAIEVDEHQHRRYDTQDEEIRYDDLYMHFSGKWIFIRFNPNSFRVAGRRKDPPLQERLPRLLEEIRLHESRVIKETNMDLMEIHRLFFDS